MSTRSTFPAAIGILIPLLLPTLQFGVFYRRWNSQKAAVDRETCNCSCWDTAFKGSYESGKHVPGYKHLYFNVTWQSFLIWSMTVAFVIAFYESVKYVVNLALDRKLNRRLMIVLFASIYPNYYTWWVYLNVWNDDFYSQFVHQTIFSVTDAILAGLVLSMCDNTRPPRPRHLVFISAIGLFHIAANAFDQFVEHVLSRNWQWYMYLCLRDIGLGSTDLIAVVIPLLELRRFAPGPVLSTVQQFLNPLDLLIAIMVAVLFSMIITFR